MWYYGRESGENDRGNEKTKTEQIKQSFTLKSRGHYGKEVVRTF